MGLKMKQPIATLDNKKDLVQTSSANNDDEKHVVSIDTRTKRRIVVTREARVSFVATDSSGHVDWREATIFV